jgi:hypothetical protein
VKCTYLAYIALPDDLAEQYELYAKDVKKNLSSFSIPRPDPKLTVMRMVCEDRHEEELRKGLAKIGSEPIPVTPLRLEKLSQTTVCIVVERNELLHRVHMKAADIFAGKQANPTTRVPAEWQDRYESYRKYGSPFFGEHYNPHLTLGYTSHNVKSDELPDPEGLSFEAKRIVLAKKEQNSGKPFKVVGRYQFT